MNISELYNTLEISEFTGIVEYSANHAKVITVDNKYNLLLNNIDSNTSLMVLIKKVKKDVESYIANKVKDINFFNFRLDNLEITDFNNFKFTGVKIDISAAYWNTAKKMFLSEKTYQYGIDNKPIRLAALGALAIKRYTDTWENGIITNKQISRPDTYNVYMEICKIVDNILSELFYLTGCAFGYFIDCVFLSTQNKHLIDLTQKYFRNKGYSTTVDFCNFSFKTEKNNLYLLSENNKEKKQYFVAKDLLNLQ